MNLVYGVKDKPKFSQMLIFAFQQVLPFWQQPSLCPASSATA